MFGLLNICKPRGLTSRDAVNRVQRLVRPHKVGHSGTLDPLSDGVLVLCLGAATRLAEYIQQMPKQYRGTFLVGKDSDTQDVEGNVVALADDVPTRERIAAALPGFLGDIQQTPPAFSALKVRGQRAYQLARRGQPVELKPRSITVHAVSIESYENSELTLEITCSSGTYIRTLGRDLAIAAGSCAVMSALTRTAVGDFHVRDACQLEALNDRSLGDHLLPASRAVGHLPVVELDDEEVHRIANGVSIDNRFAVNEHEIAGLDSTGRLVALLTPRGTDALGPIRNFPRSVVSAT